MMHKKAYERCEIKVYKTEIFAADVIGTSGPTTVTGDGVKWPWIEEEV